MRLRSFFILLGTLITICAQAASAATDALAITTAIDLHMTEYRQELSQRYQSASRIDHRISALDSRVSMKDCEHPLTVENRDQREIGRINFKVGCDKPQKWALFVPTDVRVYHPIVISNGPLYKGTKLQSHHLSLKETDISRIRGSYFFYIEDVVNMETKRQLKPGSVITSSNLRPPLMIEKGDAVVLSAQLGGLSVKTPAIALSKGRKGEQIRVQNRSSKRVVDARVTGPGAVKATL